MSTIRAARVLTVFAGHGSNSRVNSTGQAGSGAGASNQSDTASVDGGGFTSVDQSSVKVDFTGL